MNIRASRFQQVNSVFVKLLNKSIFGRCESYPFWCLLIRSGRRLMQCGRKELAKNVKTSSSSNITLAVLWRTFGWSVIALRSWSQRRFTLCLTGRMFALRYFCNLIHTNSIEAKFTSPSAGTCDCTSSHCHVCNTGKPSISWWEEKRERRVQKPINSSLVPKRFKPIKHCLFCLLFLPFLLLAPKI